MYVWDSKQRKFLPEVEAAAPGRAAQPDYNQEDMTFVADEEQIPAYDPPDPVSSIVLLIFPSRLLMPPLMKRMCRYGWQC